MVKLPVIAYNLNNKKEVISHTIYFRNQLENLSKAENVRPIVLFQAESKGKEDRQTFDKIRDELTTTYKIPREEIAIKTATINELKGVDLLAADCKIRYIITINALREGWDCPFAYILASLANRSSAVEVEQLVGRILRQPNTRFFNDEHLNQGYIFIASQDFFAMLENVVEGLKIAGFSDRDYHVEDKTLEIEKETTFQTTLGFDVPNSSNQTVPSSTSESLTVSISSFDNDEDTKNNSPAEACEKAGNIGKKNRIEIVLPQFFCKNTGVVQGNLFGLPDDDVPISREELCKGISLSDKDTQIDFDRARYQIMEYDAYENEYVLRGRRLIGRDAKNFLEYFSELPLENRRSELASSFTLQIDNKTKDFISSAELKKYIARIVSNFDNAQLTEAIKYFPTYKKIIENKIDDLISVYAAKNFQTQIDSRKIFVKPSYKLPKKISPVNPDSSNAKTLYTAEEKYKVNSLEKDFITSLAALDNVRWWHRNGARKDFFINGFKNHYPDFMLMTESGILLLIEVKGDDRGNEDSRMKLNLGKLWESKAGSDKFGYFMVFNNKPSGFDDALNFNELMARVKAL